MEKFVIGKLWNDGDIVIARADDGGMYALHGWNGEEYGHCWQVLDTDGHTRAEVNQDVTIRPVYDYANCPVDEDGEIDSEKLTVLSLEVK